MKLPDQLKAYIKAHPDAIVEDVAELFGRSVSLVMQYQKAVGVKLKTRRHIDGADWIQPHEAEASERKLSQLMKNPKVVKWLEENGFEIKF
jgi:hypothetical protein